MADDWMSDWDAAVAGVGVDYSGGVVQAGIDPVEASSIRRFCEPIELRCLIHHDKSVAQDLGYRDIVAPATSVTSAFVDPGIWRPGDATRYPTADANSNPVGDRTRMITRTNVPTPSTATSFATDVRTDYFEPVCVGDRITRHANRLISVTPKETSVGRGAFLVFESDYFNQDGRLVARRGLGTYMYNPRIADREGRRADSSGGSEAGSQRFALSTGTQRKPDLAIQFDDDHENTRRGIDEIQLGEPLQPLVTSLTVHRLVVFASACRDFAPMHHNSEFARMQGAPNMYINNVFCQAIWEQAARRHLGICARIRRIGPLRMRKFNTVGETLITSGLVDRIWEEGGETLVQLELRTAHSGGMSLGPGHVVASMPRLGGCNGLKP